MASVQPITTKIDREPMAPVDRVAAQAGRTNGEFAPPAIRRAAGGDDDCQAFLQEGVDAAERGERGAVMAGPDAMIAKHRVRCG